MNKKIESQISYYEKQIVETKKSLERKISSYQLKINKIKYLHEKYPDVVYENGNFVSDTIKSLCNNINFHRGYHDLYFQLHLNEKYIENNFQHKISIISHPTRKKLGEYVSDRYTFNSEIFDLSQYSPRVKKIFKKKFIKFINSVIDSSNSYYDKFKFDYDSLPKEYRNLLILS